MQTEEKIYKVLKAIKEKVDISPDGAIIDYRAGWENTELSGDEEIMILNKLESDGVIEVAGNFSSEYV